MCEEWLIFKYYQSCGRAKNGGPYHSHPTVCCKACAREGSGCRTIPVSPPKGRIGWRAGKCRKCEGSIGDRVWWKTLAYGRGEPPEDPTDKEIFSANKAPSQARRNHITRADTSSSHGSSIHSTETEVHRAIGPQVLSGDVVPEGEFKYEWVKTTVLANPYPEELRTNTWIGEQQGRVRNSQAHESPHKARTPISSLWSGSSVSSGLDSCPADFVAPAGLGPVVGSVSSGVDSPRANSVAAAGSGSVVGSASAMALPSSTPVSRNSTIAPGTRHLAPRPASSSVLSRDSRSDLEERKSRAVRAKTPSTHSSSHRARSPAQQSRASQNGERYASLEPLEGYDDFPDSTRRRS